MNDITRRSAVKFTAIATGIAALGSNASAQPNAVEVIRTLNGWYDVTDFGAKGDGITAASDPILKAITAATSRGGGVVWFPPGKYLLDTKVIVDRQVTLMGAGWASRDTSQGSWLIVKQPRVNLEIRGEGTTVQGIGFIQEQPTLSDGWQPADHDFAIHAAADDIFLKQIHLYNCTNGIKIEHYTGGSIGRVNLDYIWGQPLTLGIKIDNCHDVVKINNVHFWPFWSNDQRVRSWMIDNAKGFQVLNADNPQFTNLFMLGYNRGIEFGESSNGPTSKFAIVNVDTDSCEIGIEVGGGNATGMITNFNCQGLPGNVGLKIVSPGVRLFATNLRLTNYRGNALRAAGGNTRVFINNLWAEMWNKSGQGFPAIEATDGAKIYLGRPLFFDRGNGGAPWKSAGDNGGQVLTEFNNLVSFQ